MDRGKLLTELRLSESMNLDAMSVEQALAVMNAQDAVAQQAVAAISKDIAQAVHLVVAKFQKGGRLIYFGAGTSGRLGVLDASECPPTFRVEPTMVQGVIAGGREAMFVAQEGAEDSKELAAKDVNEKNVGEDDVVMGIAAGGTTPYVHGALERAKTLGATTIFLTCVQATPADPKVDLILRPLTGPEVLTGSTRLKAGTATKLVLNQITTLAMVQLGKCYENLMVDLRATNDKLWDRGARILGIVTGLEKPAAMELLKKSHGHVKVGIVMHKLKLDYDKAVERLKDADGFLRKALS